MRVATAAAFLAGAAVALGGAVGATWLTASAPEPAMTENDVQGIVQAYLGENPDIVVDAIRAYQVREQQREEQDRKQAIGRWEEHTSELQSPMRRSYAA